MAQSSEVELLRHALESLRQVDHALRLAAESRLDMREATERLAEARARLLRLIDVLCQARPPGLPQRSAEAREELAKKR